MILYLRVVPGLWVAVEECRRPELRSHPLILGGLPHERGGVREANITAQQRGVRPGMTLSQARHQCPDGIFLQPDLPAYNEVWERVCAVMQEYTPLVEPVEMGQVLCDLTGCGRLWGDDLTAARSILAAVRERAGITAWIGVASNRITAQLASRSVGGEGIAVIQPGQERAFLSNFPIASLPNVDTRLALTFQVLGLQTIGDLAALPVASVKQRFGARGERLHYLASGIDPRPVVPPPTKPVVEARDDLLDGTVEEAMERLQRLANRCAEELQRRKLAGTMIELRLDTPHPPTPLLPQRKKGEQPTGAMLPSPLEGEGLRVRGARAHFPMPYRVHSSRLPQPQAEQVKALGYGSVAIGHDMPVGDGPYPTSDLAPISAEIVADSFSPPGARPPIKRAVTVVRTPINTASALFEQAQRLLLQQWQKLEKQPDSIELIVSEFPSPRQLAFTELNRIGEIGGLGGMDATRFQAIAEGERMLAARFGDASFRHIGPVDPGNILTERRFHWKFGLPWKGS